MFYYVHLLLPFHVHAYIQIHIYIYIYIYKSASALTHLALFYVMVPYGNVLEGVKEENRVCLCASQRARARAPARGEKIFPQISPKSRAGYLLIGGP